MKYILFASCLLIGLYGILLLTKNTTQFVLPLLRKPTVTIDGQNFSVLLAITSQDQEKGLGYRPSLPQNSGMLFIFPHPYIEAFWMKGMEFPLDIIYIKDAQIIAIYQHLSNPTIAHPETPTVTPPYPANDVLEINAGLSQKYHFKVGDTVKISI